MNPLDGGLLNITLSDSESDSGSSAPKPPKNQQSQEAFQAVKNGYSVKIENGELHKQIRLPLGKGINKQHVQQAIHAVEELYFFRRYLEAADFAHNILQNAPGLDDDGPHGEARELLQSYEERSRLAAAK